VVSAAGHYKETNDGAIGEMAMNLGISLLLVKPLGLVGVALGTFAAMSFRTIHTVWYLSKHILHRPVWRFLLKLVCNLLVSVFLIIRIPVWIDIAATTIPGLLVSAIKVSVIVFPVFLAANALLSIRIIKEEIQRKN
jgi:peptidoglycan biosynthesis protein MviN/MurJ (putative lipid II flippase)